jgi:CheY-like chemotaxis protein
LDRANRIESLSRFAGTVAHDINNLLAGIQGHLAMARLQSRQPGALDAALTAAQREIERAADLTQQLLTFSRGADAPATMLDPNAVVAEVVGALERVPDGQVVVETELEPAVGRVRMAAAQLNQIVLNLLLNSREAVRGGGWVQVRTGHRRIEAKSAWPPERVGDWVLITVTDTGVGMDNATRARMFEPFFTTKRAGQGAGLGLSTVYGLVRQAGGWIDVESEYGKGSRFEVYLPAHDGEDATVRGDAADSVPAEKSGSETVLVCDDEARLAMLTAGLLDQYGFGAITVTSCEEALAALGSDASECDVILLDVHLPDGTAGEVLERMRSRGYHQPVILTSGYAEEDVSPDLISDAQVTGYLAKPYSVDRLVGEIRRALDRGAG